ncbi:ankyrin repeat domain-containing protein [Desulfobulbus sp. TB]|nr:ankyrin repeat domain-containing protein [Desulfobulbus sp. TB]
MKMIINRYILISLLVPLILFHSSGIAVTETIDPEERLWNAVREETIQSVEEALKNGATGNVFFPKSNGIGFGFSRSLKKTALMLAAENGNLSITELLIKNGAKAALSESTNNHNAFTLAVKNGHEDIAKMLIDNASDAEDIIKQAGTALFAASTNGYTELVEIILDRGVDPNIGYIDPISERKIALLPEVIKKGHIETAKFLIEQGINVNSYTKNEDTALIAAAKKGFFEIVKLLIENKAEVNIKTYISGDTALIAATRKGNVDIVKYLLNNKADANIKNDHKATALIISSTSGHLEIVKNLIEFGANVNVKGHRGETSGLLLHALNNKHPEVVCYLIEHGADINIADNKMLMTAIYRRYPDVIKLLLEKNINVNSADRYGTTPLMEASRTAGREGYYEIVKMLLEHGADVNAENKKGETPLIMAAKDGSTKTVQLFLENKANPNHQDQRGKSALMYALEAFVGLDSSELLLSHGAKCTLQDSNGETVLIKFIDNALRGLKPKSEDNYFSFLQKIFDSGADVNTQDVRGNTALMTIANKGGYVTAKEEIHHLRAKIVKTLIDNNADTSLLDKKGNTALDYAKEGKRSYIIELLEWEKNRGKNPTEDLLIGAAYNDIELVRNSIKNDTDVNSKFSSKIWQGGSSLVIAVNKGYDEIAKFLISEGADVNERFEDGTTALMSASQNGQMELVQALLEKGAKVNEKNNDGITALLIASGNGRTDVVKELLNNNADPYITYKGVSALMFAERGGFSEVVQILKKKGLKTYREIQELALTLLEAVSSGSLNAVRQALKNGADVNDIFDYGEFEGASALMLAASEGHLDIVTYLLKHGADVHYKINNSACGEIVHHPSALLGKDWKNPTPHRKRTYTIGEAGHSLFNYMRLNKCSGNTALMYAVLGGDTDIINLLLQRGIDVDVKNDIGVTPLIIAATIGDTPVVKFLLERGADINAKSSGKLRPNPLGLALSMLFKNKVKSTPIEDEKLRDDPELGISPVIGASFNGHTELIKLLIQKGASISDNNGSLALQGAIVGNHTNTLKMLLDKGVTPKSVNLPASLLATAAANGYLGIVKILLDNGMNINGMEVGKAPYLYSPLMTAAEAGHIAVVKLLLDRGAEKYISIYRVTAYMLAKSNDHKEIMKLLEDKKVKVESFNVEAFQVLDPACEEKTDCEGKYLHEELKGNISIVDVKKEKIPEMEITRTGIVTDGITRLVLRVKTKQPVKFVLIPPKDMISDRSSKCDWGTLSEYDRSREHCESIEVSYTDGDYTYALYRSPANFPLKSLKKPIFVTIKAIAKTTGEEIEKKIQLFQPPVVLVHGLWSTKKKWQETYYVRSNPFSNHLKEYPSFKKILEKKGINTCLVDYSLKERATSTFNPHSSSYAIKQLVEGIDTTLLNYRKKDIAITQMDVVGHSMGGLIARARTVYNLLPFKILANYKRGDFHKIITIGTPHQGSPIANVLVECKDATRKNCTFPCYENCYYSCQTITCRSECQKKCGPQKGITCSRTGWVKLSDVLDLELWLGLKDATPVGKAVYDLQVGSDAIRLLPETIVPSHAIVGRNNETFNSTDEVAMNTSFLWFDVDFKSDNSSVTVDKLLGGSKYHDAIVAEKSQKGGLVNKQFSIVENVIHTDEPLSGGVRENTLRLLLEEVELKEKTLLPKETELFGFFKPFHAKMKGELTTCDELPKKIEREEISTKATLSTEPIPGTVVKLGGKLHVRLDITDGTAQNSAIFNIGGKLIHLKGEPPYVVDYDLPKNKAGELTVNGITLGDSEESYSFKSYVIVKPDKAPVSISSSSQNIVLSHSGETYQLYITGKYPDNSEVDITTSSAGTTYATKSGTENIVSVSPEGEIEARGDGRETVIIKNDKHVISVDVTVKVLFNIPEFIVKGEISLPETAQSDFIFSDTDDKKIPLGFTIRCNYFDIKYHPDSGMPKEYLTGLTVLEDGKEVLTTIIKVNKPFTYKGVTFYQVSYNQLGAPIIKLREKNSDNVHAFPVDPQDYSVTHKWRQGESDAMIRIQSARPIKMSGGKPSTEMKIWMTDSDGPPSRFTMMYSTPVILERPNAKYELSIGPHFATGLKVEKKVQK